MTVKEATYYYVQCDGPGCEFKTGDTGSDYSAWGDSGAAADDWECSDLQSTAEGKHYCDAHRLPMCADCGRTEGLVNDDPDGKSGDWWCAEHLETAPEYEAPPGVVV